MTMKCPCCNQPKDSEYLHVLAVEPGHFNYCCSECLAKRLLNHIKFIFNDSDKKEIRELAVQEFNTCFELKREEIRSIVWEEIGKLLDIQKQIDDKIKSK